MWSFQASFWVVQQFFFTVSPLPQHTGVASLRPAYPLLHLALVWTMLAQSFGGDVARRHSPLILCLHGLLWGRPLLHAPPVRYRPMVVHPLPFTFVQ